MSLTTTRCFALEADGVSVFHSAVIAQGDTALTQAEDLREAIAALPGRPVFARILVSDVANQHRLLDGIVDCPCSFVQQFPLCGAKFAAFVISEEGRKGNSPHRFTAGVAPEGDSFAATVKILSDFAATTDMADECVRTWFFVNDIDNNYAGMVEGRNKVFAHNGLTAQTHFIASTGIAGRSADHRAPVTFDAWCVEGLTPDRVTYLKALTHLNPTIEYGVAFERATAVDFAECRLILVSGTASIDNKGEILHPGDVKAQIVRMLENIEALLAEGGATMNDLLHAIVYLRDPADYLTVKTILESRLPVAIPTLIVQAPVCRPGWLVEMECMTMTSASNPHLPHY